MASPLIKTVLEVSLISPPPGTVPDSSVPLTSFDLPWFNFSPVHRIFFYSSPCPITPLIESLKSSLSLTLQRFYTLAGTVCLSPDSNDNRIDIQYKDGDSIRFTVAESISDFNELAAGTKREYCTQIHPLLPQQSGLLAVQVTVFPGHGICIGYTIPHVAGDGSSTVRFLKSWASVCRSGALAGTPIYDRSLITEIPGYYSVLHQSLIQSRPVPTAETSPSPGVILGLFTLGRDKIERLKQRVREHDEHTHCSTFVVSSAYAWVCFVKTRRCFTDYLTARFLIAVDCRRRLDPAVPDSYFGNCLRPCVVEEAVRVLKGEDGVLEACLAIGKAVEGLKEGIMSGAGEWERKLMAIEQETLLSVAGSPKLGVYDVDFGWGKPARVEVPSRLFNFLPLFTSGQLALQAKTKFYEKYHHTAEETTKMSKPVHPATVHFPIAFLSLGYGLDILHSLGGNLPNAIANALPPANDLSRAAYYMLSLGLITSIPAVMSGGQQAVQLFSKQGMYEADGRTLKLKSKAVIAHAVTNDLVLAVTTYLWYSRRQQAANTLAGKLGVESLATAEAAYAPQMWQVIAEVLALGVLLFAASIGGALTYNYGVGFAPAGKAGKKSQ